MNQIDNSSSQHNKDGSIAAFKQPYLNMENGNFDDFLSNSALRIDEKIVPFETKSIIIGTILPSFVGLIFIFVSVFLIGTTDLFARFAGFKTSDLFLSKNDIQASAKPTNNNKVNDAPLFSERNAAFSDNRLIHSPGYSLIAPDGLGLQKRSFVQDKYFTDWTHNTWENASRGYR